MAIEDGLCLAHCIAAANGDSQAAFRRYENARVVRTARVTFESRYIWDIYHSDGIRRDVNFQMLGERSEAATFQCLAWLDASFATDDDVERFRRSPWHLGRAALRAADQALKRGSGLHRSPHVRSVGYVDDGAGSNHDVRRTLCLLKAFLGTQLTTNL